MGILQARILEWVARPSSKGFSQLRDQTQSPTLQVDSLLSESPGKPKNTGVGSLSLLQGNFPIQESNEGLLHCGQILYQLSHQGSPRIVEWVAYPFSRELPDPGIESGSSALQADSLPAELPGKPSYSLFPSNLTPQPLDVTPVEKSYWLPDTLGIAGRHALKSYPC